MLSDSTNVSQNLSWFVQFYQMHFKTGEKGKCQFLKKGQFGVFSAIGTITSKLQLPFLIFLRAFVCIIISFFLYISSSSICGTVQLSLVTLWFSVVCWNGKASCAVSWSCGSSIEVQLCQYMLRCDDCRSRNSFFFSLTSADGPFVSHSFSQSVSVPLAVSQIIGNTVGLCSSADSEPCMPSS